MARRHEAVLWLQLLAGTFTSRRDAKMLLERWCMREQHLLSDFAAAPAAEAAEVTGLSTEQVHQAQQLLAQARESQARMGAFAEANIELIIRTDAAYPEELAHNLPEAELPYLLFAIGELDHLAETGVAIGGAHDAAAADAFDLHQMAAGLAALPVPMLGGFERGVERELLLRVPEVGGRITVMLPLGLDHAAPILALLRPSLEAGRALVLSPFLPEQVYSERGGQARLSLLSAMAGAMLQIEPDASVDDWPGARQLLARGEQVAVVSRSDSAIVRGWEAAGARINENCSSALTTLSAGWSLDAEAGAEPHALPGVEPIVFHDADEAIDVLGRSGRVPPALARRLRESGMFGYQDVEDVDEPYQDPEPDV
jgi:predicted Rossmann fold nucleotide-binding protein DprA/Smf involved in DNA uptake